MASIAKSNKNNKIPGSLVAGGTSGFISCILLQPLDLVKTRIQQQPSKLTTYGTIKLVANNEGILGLWRGSVPTVLRNVPGSAFYFATLAQLRHTFSSSPQFSMFQQHSSNSKSQTELTPVTNLLLGAFARGFVGLMFMPVSVIKVRYESSLYGYTSLGDAVKDIARKEGLRGYFVGYGSTLIRDVPYAGVFVYLYEIFKKQLGPVFNSNSPNVNYEGNQQSTTVNLISGLTAGFLATLTTQPFDMLKTRVQLQPEVYKNMFHGTRIIIKESGIQGFFAGMVPRLLRKTLNAAITWTIYEEITAMWKKRNQ
ncbi:mitochondrial carrier domain-containing protein [Paraphysoderma sedebokerense]|nr:mitochondrial carrier domain-containing protein [Paraphysoderma sedebokerense]